MLAHVNGEPAPEGRPTHPADLHEQAIELLGEMLDAEQQAIAELGAEIAELRAVERDHQQQVLEAAAGAAELQYAQALAEFAPHWSRFAAAHRLAYESDPSLPDLVALAEVDIEAVEAEVRKVLEQPEGLMKRAARKLLELAAA